MTMRIQLLCNIEALVAAYSGPVRNSVARVLRTLGLGTNESYNIGRTVAAKSNFTIDTYDRVVQAFSDAWPDDRPWPAGIERPEPTGRSASSDVAA